MSALASLRDGFLLVLVGAAIGFGACLILHMTPRWPSVPVPVSVPAPPAPEIAKETTTKVACKELVVYRDAAKKKLDLPATLAATPTAHVTRSSQIPGDEHPRTVTAVTDTATGLTELLVRTDPLPWLGLHTRRSLGISYGFKDDAAQAVARVHGEIELAQIKALHLGARANLDSDGDWFAGVGLSFRW